MIKEYKQLTIEERKTTFEKYQKFCEEDENLIPFKNFEQYDEEQEFINMDFDEKTLECLG